MTDAHFLPPPAYLRTCKDQIIPQSDTDTTSEAAQVDLTARITAHINSEHPHYTARQRAWATERGQIRRYLRAREGKVDDAFALLASTLAWRDQEGMWTVREDRETALRSEGETGKMFRFGCDLQGRPLIHSFDRRQNSDSHEGKVLFVSSVMEAAVESMDVSKGVEQVAFVFDFNGYSYSNAPPMKTSRAVLDIWLSHYPERMGAAFMLDAPWLFNVFFKAVSPFLPAATKAKIHFISGSTEEKKKALREYIDDATIDALPAFGKDDDGRWDANTYLNETKRQHDLWVENEEKLYAPAASAAPAAPIAQKTKAKKSRKK